MDALLDNDIKRSARRIALGLEGHVARFYGDSRVNPDLSHTPSLTQRWTSIVSNAFGLQQRNRGEGGTTIIGDDSKSQWPRMLVDASANDGPGSGYSNAVTQRRYRAALFALLDGFNTGWKWPVGTNPNIFDTAERGYEAWCRLARADYFFRVGSGNDPSGATLLSPGFNFPAAWSQGAYNSAYGVGPTSLPEAQGAKSFTYTTQSGWPGGIFTVYFQTRVGVGSYRRGRIRAKIDGGPYVASYDTTGNTGGQPALGITGAYSLASISFPVPAGSGHVITFDVDQVTEFFTIMGCSLHVGDVPAPLVLLVNQPLLPTMPDPTHPDYTDTVRQELNTRQASVAALFTDGRVAVVDLTRDIQGEAKYYQDDVHYSNAGHAVIADRVMRKIVQKGLHAAYSKPDPTYSGPPAWIANPGDRVWDPATQRSWFCGTDPNMETNGDQRSGWIPEGARLAVTKTADYTLDITDGGGLLEVNAATAKTITVPPNSSVKFPVGTTIDIVRLGAGDVNIAAGAGVTIDSAFGLTIASQYGVARLRKRATDEWVLTGQLADPATQAELDTALAGIFYPVLGDRVDAFSGGTAVAEYWRGAVINPAAPTNELGGNDIAINIAKWRKFRLQGMLYTGGTADPGVDWLVQLRKVTSINGGAATAPIGSVSAVIASINLTAIAKNTVGAFVESADLDPVALGMTDGLYIITVVPSGATAANSRVYVRQRLIGYPVVT